VSNAHRGQFKYTTQDNRLCALQLLVYDSVIKAFCLTSGLFLLDVGNSQDFLF